MTAFLWLAFTSSFWFLKFLFLAGWFVARWTTWLLWPDGMLVAGLGALCGLGCRQASAGSAGHRSPSGEKSARAKKDKIPRDSQVIPAKTKERAKGLEPSTSSLGS